MHPADGEPALLFRYAHHQRYARREDQVYHPQLRDYPHFLFIHTFVTILLLNVCAYFRVNTYHCDVHERAYICGMIEI